MEKKMTKLIKLVVILIFIAFFCVFTVDTAGATTEATSERIELVILLTIDGCRADKLVEANTPNLDSLAAEGTISLYTITISRSYTTAAHASLLTGADFDVHNYDTEGDNPTAETILEAFEETGERTALIDGKGGRIRGLERGVSYQAVDVDYRSLADCDNQVIAKVISILEENNPTFLFALLPKVDSTGHGYGHTSAEYLSAIENADAAIGVLVGWLKEQGIYDSTLLVITADHGMQGISHGEKRHGNRLTPLILRGPSVMENGKIYSAEIIDIAPTIAELFGIEPPQNAEGAMLTFMQVQILSLLSPVSGAELRENIVFEWFEIPDVTYELLVDNDLDFSSPEIDPLGLTNGTYSAQLTDGDYVWRVRAVDLVGKIVAESPVRILVVDTVPPHLTVRKLPEKTDTPSLVISGVTEPLLMVRIYIDGELADEVTAEKETGKFTSGVTLTEGVNSITVEAVDAAGNVSQTSAQVTYEYAKPEMPTAIILAVVALVIVVGAALWKVKR